jgi:hypothetical protein
MRNANYEDPHYITLSISCPSVSQLQYFPQKFTLKHPHSVFSLRVRGGCTNEADISPANEWRLNVTYLKR